MFITVAKTGLFKDNSEIFMDNMDYITDNLYW